MTASPAPVCTVHVKMESMAFIVNVRMSKYQVITVKNTAQTGITEAFVKWLHHYVAQKTHVKMVAHVL